MAVSSKGLGEISSLIVQGNLKDAKPLFDNIMQGDVPADDCLTIFKLFPRSLTTKHLGKILKAETDLGVVTASQILAASRFEGVDKSNRVAALTHVSERLANDEVYGLDVYNCNLDYIKEWDGKSDVDAQAESALLFAIKDSHFFNFESLVDTFKSVKYSPKKASTKQLSEFVEKTLVSGTNGVADLEKFLTSSGKDFASLKSALQRKCQLITLANLAKPGSIIPFDKLSQPLGAASDEEIQRVAIDASIVGIVRVRVDLDAKVVHAMSSVPLSFDADAWKKLQGNLGNWQERVDKIISAYDSK